MAISSGGVSVTGERRYFRGCLPERFFWLTTGGWFENLNAKARLSPAACPFACPFTCFEGPALQGGVDRSAIEKQ